MEAFFIDLNIYGMSFMDKKLFFSVEIVFLLALFIVFEFSGNFFRLYDLFEAYDIVTHFLGGALVASVSIKFLFQYLKNYSYALNVVFTTGIGAVWEMVEFFLDLLFGFGLQNGLNDTMVDLMMVMSAAIIVNFIERWKAAKK